MGDEAAQDVDWETASEEVKKERIKKIFDDLDENKACAAPHPYCQR